MTKILIFSLAVCAAVLFAGETRTWSQLDYADFQKGAAKNLSLRSDGTLSLAPASKQAFDASTAYLWAIAQDSKGNLYVGGADAKLYEIPPQGKGRTLASLDALEIHAIAVDSKDRVYAATSPDGKVYRIAGSGKPEVFYDPKAKYIWALAFDGQGNLFVATGDQGEIHKVTPEGKGTVFYRTGEAHARSMAFDGAGNLIVGTDPGGLILRVTPAGEGFVLYQMDKREVTAVAVARDRSIYAAGVGSRQAGAASAPAAQTAPAPPPSVTAAAVLNPLTGAPAIPVAIRPSAPPPSAAASTPSGGSEVVRIAPDGSPEKMWSNAQDVAYALAFDGSGRVLVGAGNKGNVYRIESPTVYTALLTLAASQVTAFAAGSGGRLYAATGNSGQVFEIGPGIEREGTLESDVFDSSMYSLWGRLSFEADLHGGQVALESRTGNLDSPQLNWSPWSPAITDAKGAPIASPAARFVQWKATLTASAAGASPELESVDVAYLEKNVAPRVDRIEFTPPNYKFPAPTTPLFQPRQTLSLPAMGAPSLRGGPVAMAEITPAMQAAKGFVGARWTASDPNGDTLIYKVEIRGAGETEWKPLADKLGDKYYAWDSTAYPDGEYRLRVTASDEPGNPPPEALTASLVSDVFIIDNTPPRITGLAATRSGGKLEVRWHAADALNDIDEAEYSLDGGDWTTAAPVTKLSDSPDLDYALSLDVAPGEHTVAVRVKDDYDNQAVEKTVVRP